jgi:hypothetical protein
MSLRDQLRGRALPTEVVRLPMDPAAWTRAERARGEAQWALDEARGSGGRDTSGLRARVAAAQEQLDGLPCLEVTLRTLPPPEWEALVELHPATGDQQERGMQWNPATFRPALLAACVVPADGDEPLSAEDWSQVVKDGELGAGEYNTLINTAVALNLRAPASAVGNGS